MPDQVREQAVAKASSDWNDAESAVRTTMPGATAGEVLEAALQSPAGVEAATRLQKHDGGASERAAIMQQLHSLAVAYQQSHPEETYERAFTQIIKVPPGYHLHRRYVEST